MPVSLAAFDHALRISARPGQPARILDHAPIVTTPQPVAVRAHRSGSRITVTATTPGTRAATAHDADALALLGDLGVRLSEPTPATLLTDQPGTLAALGQLARLATPNTDTDDAAAHIAWWLDRADFPHGRAVVHVPTACRTRWLTGASLDAEEHTDTWLHWLGLPTDPLPGLLALHARLLDVPPLTYLDTLTADDLWTYEYSQTSHRDGWDWRRPETPARAALGLRERCDAADLYAAALLSDPLHRTREVCTGYVVTGTADDTGEDDALRRITITCDRLDARLRTGNDVTGWIGTPTTTTDQRFSGTVTRTDARHGHLVLTLTGTTGHKPTTPGVPLTLIPAPPSPRQQRDGRRRYRALYNARRSWLSTGRPATTSRRPVPLDVLVAGAEDDA